MTRLLKLPRKPGINTSQIPLARTGHFQTSSFVSDPRHQPDRRLQIPLGGSAGIPRESFLFFCEKSLDIFRRLWLKTMSSPREYPLSNMLLQFRKSKITEDNTK